MLKRISVIILIVAAGCSNPPPPKEKAAAPPKIKKEVSAPKPAASQWSVNSFAPKEGDKEGRKYVKYATTGIYSDSTQTNSYLFAEVFIDKQNGGIFLHELKKSAPSRKFNSAVQIKMTNSSGQELNMTSSRSWNKSGGILIERNNNDYSQFRIFLLQSNGNVDVEIKDSGSRIYSFKISTEGLNDSFGTI
jgi:hypothetical protein